MNRDSAPRSMSHTSRGVIADQQKLSVHQEQGNVREPEAIDLSTWEPSPSDVVTFKCTEELTGRIFLIPTGGRLFVLDFVDEEKHRVFDTGLHVYTTGFFGAAGRDRLLTLESDPFAPFILNPAGTIEITPQGLPDEVLKSIVFACSRGVYKPVVF